MTLKDLCVRDTATIREAVAAIDANRTGIVLVVDANGRLTGTVTDGDVRRGVLRQEKLDGPVAAVMSRTPIVARDGDPPGSLQELLQRHRIRHVPLLDEEGRPTRLFTLADAARQGSVFACAIVMAGGMGKRLRPLTDTIPKPMIRVNDAPILESILKGIAKAGVRRVYISVNYKSEIIKSYFGDGAALGVEIRYLDEDAPLGTAGPLSLIQETPTGPILVVNGDVLTTSDFSLLFDFHCRHRALATVAAFQHEVTVPYGVLRTAEHYVVGLDEKPVLKVLCSAGIYVLDPEVLGFVPKSKEFNMTDLLDILIANGLPVTAFPIREYWMDIGQPQDLERATRDYPLAAREGGDAR